MPLMVNVLRGLVSLMAVPGALFVAASIGALEMPAEMRTPEKFTALGIASGSTLARTIMLSIGLGKWYVAARSLSCACAPMR